MTRFWERGALFVKELQELYAEPKPHFNTLSTMVRKILVQQCLKHCKILQIKLKNILKSIR